MKFWNQRRWMTIAAVVLVLGTAGRVFAQDDDAELPPLPSGPIVVFNVASIDRGMEDIDYLFGTVERSDMVEVINGLLEGVGNLEGVSREKPLGMMLFLEPGITPRPAGVFYVPVDDQDDFLNLFKQNQVLDVRELRVSDGDTTTESLEISFGGGWWHVDFIDGYAFAADDESTLDRAFPNPAEAFKALSTRYDAAIDVHPKNIPPGMRELFLSLVRTQTQAEIQQRDNEPDFAYAMRKAQGLGNLHTIEMILQQTQTLTLGLDVSKKSRQAVVEAVVEADAESEFLESLQELAEEPSRFTPVLEEDAAIAGSINAKVDKYTVDLYRDMFEDAQESLARALTRMSRGGPLAGAVDAGDAEAPVVIDPISEALAERFFKPLFALIEAESVDAFAQFRLGEDDHYLLIGAVEIPTARAMETPAREIIEQIRASQPDFNEEVRVDYDVADVGDVALHRLVPQELPDDVARNFGENFAFYVGFDNSAIWFAIGGRQAEQALREAITQVADAGLVEGNRDEAPVSLRLTAGRLLSLGGEDDSDDEGRRLTREAFSGGDDSLRINYRPTKQGGRLRIELEEGFLRLLGLSISHNYDESQL